MLVRVVANAIKPRGGGEMSMQTIVRMLVARGHRVVWHPTTEDAWPWDAFCDVGTPFWRNAEWECDLLFYVTNNTTLPVTDRRRKHRPVDPERWRQATKAARKQVLHINWECIGDATKIARQFSHYAFLSTALRDEFVRVTRVAKRRTWVHASAVDPTPFLCCTPEYDRLLIVRHSDPWKWPACTVSMIPQIATRRQDAAFRVMGLHHDWAYRIKRALPSFEACVARRLPAWAFLDRASLFMYPVKPDYREQGPRTIVEAMAAGLPCIVDNRDGPSDRVTLETGWLMNRHADYAPMIARIAPAELREKGEAARERARTVFRPEDWADWIEEVATS